MDTPAQDATPVANYESVLNILVLAREVGHRANLADPHGLESDLVHPPGSNTEVPRGSWLGAATAWMHFRRILVNQRRRKSPPVRAWYVSTHHAVSSKNYYVDKDGGLYITQPSSLQGSPINVFTLTADLLAIMPERDRRDLEVSLSVQHGLQEHYRYS